MNEYICSNFREIDKTICEMALTSYRYRSLLLAVTESVLSFAFNFPIECTVEPVKRTTRKQNKRFPFYLI